MSYSKLAPPPATWRLVLTNALSGLLLALISIEALPCFPESWKLAVRPTTERLGIWQEHWNMFAPEIDAVNQRFVVQIGYENGQTVQWQTPAWKKLATGERFAACRLAEYYDNVLNSEVTRRAFAKYLAEQHRPSPTKADRPRWVKIIVERHHFAPPPPGNATWPSPNEPYEFEDREVLPKVKFP